VRRVCSLSIVEDFDPREDRPVCRRPRRPGRRAGELRLQRGEEALGHVVVEARASPAHRNRYVPRGERLTVRNFGREPLDLILTLTYGVHFDDMFTVRGVPVGRRDTQHPPQITSDRLHFRYDGADDHRRTTSVTFAPPPARIAGQRARCPFQLAPGAAQAYTVAIVVADEPIDSA